MTGLADAMTILSTSVNASLMFIRKKRDITKTQTGSFGKEVVAADVMAWWLVRTCPKEPPHLEEEDEDVKRAAAGSVAADGLCPHPASPILDEFG